MPPFNACFSQGWVAKLAWEANQGSLDAAKALHDAVLPGWHCRVTRGKHTREAIVQRDMMAGEYASGEADDTARAWLIAIIRALIEEATRPGETTGPQG